MKFDVRVFFKTLARKFEFHYNQTKITVTLHEEQYIFFILSRSFLLRMGNVSEKSCRENQNTHFVFNNVFFKNRADYEITWENFAAPDRSQMACGECALHAG